LAPHPDLRAVRRTDPDFDLRAVRRTDPDFDLRAVRRTDPDFDLRAGFGHRGCCVRRDGGVGRHRRCPGRLSLLQAVLDHLEWEEVLTLLAEHPAQPLDVGVVELPVARGRPLGVDETLALEEPDLRDGDVGELLAKQREDVADRQVGAPAHRAPSSGHGSSSPAVTVVIHSPPRGTPV
jgi:hypothetical protein